MTGTFIEEVQARAAGMPWVVEQTSDGFDVRLDVTGPMWIGLFSVRRTDVMYVHHVILDEAAHTYSIRDDSRHVTWSAAADGQLTPTVGASVSRQIGTVRETQKVYSFGRGGLKENEQFALNSEEGRRLITDAAGAAGYTKTMNGQTRIGLIAGGIGAAIAVLAVVIAVIAILLK